MAPKKIQTVLPFKVQSVHVAEDAPPRILPNSQAARKSSEKKEVELYSALATLNSLLDKGFDEVAPLVRDTVRKITQSTGVKPKRPRESDASKAPAAQTHASATRSIRKHITCARQRQPQMLQHKRVEAGLTEERGQRKSSVSRVW